MATMFCGYNIYWVLYFYLCGGGVGFVVIYLEINDQHPLRGHAKPLVTETRLEAVDVIPIVSNLVVTEKSQNETFQSVS